MISITRLLELKKDLTLTRAFPPRNAEYELRIGYYMEAENRLGEYQDILEDYLRIQQGSA